MNVFNCLFLSFMVLGMSPALSAVGDDSSSKEMPDTNDYVEIGTDYIILGNHSEKMKTQDYMDYVEAGKMVFSYNNGGNVYDFFYERYLPKSSSICYFFDEEHILHMVKMSNVAESPTAQQKRKQVGEAFDYSYDRYHERKSQGRVENGSNERTKKNELPSTTDPFCSPVGIYENLIVNQPYGYVVSTTNLYRETVQGINFYRIDNKVQLTSGRAAVETGYSTNWRSNYSLITATLVKNVQYGYGTWYSNQPQRLDYYPKTVPAYQTITSGINVGLTLGRTTSVGASYGENGFGVTADSAFESNFSLGYFYQSTTELAQPFLNSMWLSTSVGAAWEFTGFLHSPEATVTVYPGIFAEVTPCPYLGRIDGELTLNIKYRVAKYVKLFEVWCASSETWVCQESDTILLDNQLGA